MRELTITIERSAAWRPPPPTPRKRRPSGESPLFERPARCTVAGATVHAKPTALPFPDAAFDRIDCRELLEFVRNDDGTAAELARVLAPGGRMVVRVPATGALAGLDALNLHRYLIDISRRGHRPWETAENGWRRHYHPGELAHLLGLRAVRAERRRLGIAELLDALGRARFRWRHPNAERYAAWHRRVARLERLEDRLRTPVGILLTLELEKPAVDAVDAAHVVLSPGGASPA